MAPAQIPLQPERGRFLRPFHTGIFIRDYLLGKGPFGSPVIDPERGAAIEDIRYAYKNALFREYAEDMVAMAMEKGIVTKYAPSSLSRREKRGTIEADNSLSDAESRKSCVCIRHLSYHQ